MTTAAPRFDPERLQRVNALLEVVLALPPPQREAWVRKLPAEQQPLAPLLRTLLARAAVETDDFMRRPVDLGLGDSSDDDEPADHSGDEIGPYRLIRPLDELLTGQRPYRLGRSSAAALEEAILNAEVLPASACVQADRRLARQLRGDLDTVLDKALRKDPAQRYASVDSFAADVKRHLAGEPVLARAQSRRYRAAKFVRRHRLALAAAGAIGASLIVGAGVALWQAGAARAEAARAEEVKRFTASIFMQATPREGVGGAVTAADLLAAAAGRIEKELAGNPRVAAELGVMVGEGYAALGEPMKGEAALPAAVAHAERAYGRKHPPSVRARLLLSESINLRDVDAAEAIVDGLLPDAIAGLPETAETASNALSTKSFLLAKHNRAEESYEALRQAIAISERHLGAQHAQTIEALGLLSNTYGRFGERARQLEVATEALRRARSTFAAARPHVLLAGVERWYGEALRANDRPGDAEPILRQVVQDQRRRLAVAS